MERGREESRRKKGKGKGKGKEKYQDELISNHEECIRQIQQLVKQENKQDE